MRSLWCFLIQHDWVLIRKGNLERDTEYDMMTQGEGDHLQANEEAYNRSFINFRVVNLAYTSISDFYSKEM